ncbi:MAG: hypothetical protein JSC188_000496 [Candidatus Tokpelaia sp. JSC188]|nr:MAG: hypothetical protein JSC188_000496 [Candidatus Tokpelaia sp. JSC188]
MNFDRKSSNCDDKAQISRDPIMELARLFSEKPENIASNDRCKINYSEPAKFLPLKKDNGACNTAGSAGEENFSNNILENEEDSLRGKYCRKDDGNKALPFSKDRGLISSDIFNIGDNDLTALKDNSDEELCSVEDDWCAGSCPYEGGYKVTQFYSERDEVQQWMHAESKQSHSDIKNQALSDISYSSGAMEKPTNTHLVNETFIADQTTHPHYEKDEAIVSEPAVNVSNEYAMHAESLSQNVNQLDQMRADTSASSLHVQRPANATFDDASYIRDMSKHFFLSAEEYETTSDGIKDHMTQEPTREGSFHFSYKSEQGQQLRYNSSVGPESGHRYGYTVQYGAKKSYKTIHNSCEQKNGIEECSSCTIADEKSCRDDIYSETKEFEIPYQDTVETLPDFDTALDETRVEKTEVFDLPLIYHEDEAVELRGRNPFDQEFADIFPGGDRLKDQVVSDAEFRNLEKESSQKAQGFFPQKCSGDDCEENINPVYDWALSSSLRDLKKSNVEKVISKNRHRWLYNGIIVTMLFALGTGTYIFFFSKNAEDALPVIIHAEQEELKVKAQNVSQMLANRNEQAVYNLVEGDIPKKSRQESLIDETETPLDISEINKRLPLATKDVLDQSLVEIPGKTTANVQNPPVSIMSQKIFDPERKNSVISKLNQEGKLLRSKQFLDDEGVSITGTTGRASININDIALSQNAMLAAQKHLLPTITNDMAKNSMAKEEGDQKKSSYAVNDSAQKLFPLLSIPDKPEVFTHIDDNAAKQVFVPHSHEETDVTADDFYIQISSHASKGAAQQSAHEAKQHFGSVISNNNILIVPADIPGRGTYYRVRIPVGDRDAALNMCEHYKQAGGNCFVGH